MCSSAERIFGHRQIEAPHNSPSVPRFIGEAHSGATDLARVVVPLIAASTGPRRSTAELTLFAHARPHLMAPDHGSADGRARPPDRRSARAPLCGRVDITTIASERVGHSLRKRTPAIDRGPIVREQAVRHCPHPSAALCHCSMYRDARTLIGSMCFEQSNALQ